LGLALLVYLKDQEDISDVLVTDINEESIKERIAWLNDKKFSAKVIDATDYDSLVSVMRGYDVAMNVARTPQMRLIATKAALEAGANYIDSGAGGIRQGENSFHEKYH